MKRDSAWLFLLSLKNKTRAPPRTNDSDLKTQAADDFARAPFVNRDAHENVAIVDGPVTAAPLDAQLASDILRFRFG
jgi:hypothetical protein